jgi:hypothetical protein
MQLAGSCPKYRAGPSSSISLCRFVHGENCCNEPLAKFVNKIVKAKQKPGFRQNVRARPKWFKNLRTEVKLPLIAGIFLLLAAVITGSINVVTAIINAGSKAPTVSPAPAAPLVSASASLTSPTPYPYPTPEIPLPEIATIYRTAGGTLFIRAYYDPPLLRRGETLCLQASTRESFDDVPMLLPQSEVESLYNGKTEGRLVYDPGDQPVWYRFVVLDAHQKPFYGKSAIAKKR